LTKKCPRPLLRCSGAPSPDLPRRQAVTAHVEHRQLRNRTAASKPWKDGLGSGYVDGGLRYIHWILGKS
jgi:hypothetical protein